METRVHGDTSTCTEHTWKTHKYKKIHGNKMPVDVYMSQQLGNEVERQERER